MVIIVKVLILAILGNAGPAMPGMPGSLAEQAESKTTCPSLEGKWQGVCYIKDGDNPIAESPYSIVIDQTGCLSIDLSGARSEVGEFITTDFEDDSLSYSQTELFEWDSVTNSLTRIMVQLEFEVKKNFTYTIKSETSWTIRSGQLFIHEENTYQSSAETVLLFRDCILDF